MKQRIALLISLVLGILALSSPALALSSPSQSGGVGFYLSATAPPPATTAPAASGDTESCDSVKLAIHVGCKSTGANNEIFDYARAIIFYLSSIFGIIMVLMIIASGFLFLTSAGSPGALKKAKLLLANVVISIFLFALMFGILNYLIPGGVI